MIGVELSKIKGMFFDRPAVQKAVDKRTRSVLSRLGAFVRTTARQSIRRFKSPSKPGHPPHTHTGLLKKIFYGYDAASRSVIVGPIRFSKATSTALPALEYGGQSIVMVGRGRKEKRRVLIKKRPFMRPALEREIPKLPGLWANSVK